MSRKYTYEDWKEGKEVEPCNSGIGLYDFYRGIVKDGRMEYEELNKIREKQKWIYENAIQINRDADINLLKSELIRTDFPDTYLEQKREKVKAEINEDPHIKERVLDGDDDYYNMTGSDLNEVERVLYRRNENNFYQIFCNTYIDGKWVENKILRVTTLLHFQKFLNSFDLKAFIEENENEEQQTKAKNRGRKRSKDLTIEMTKDFVNDYKEDFKGRRDKFHKDGRIIKNRLYEYIDNSVNKDTEVISRATIHRRIKEVLGKSQN